MTAHRADAAHAKDQQDWGTIVITRGIYPIAFVATPGFLLVLMVFFVSRAFSHSLGAGVRSFSSVLLPLMVLGLMRTFQKERLRRAERFNNTLVLGLTLLIGVAVMQLLTIAPTGIPLAELVLAGSFSVLLFSHAALPENKDKAMFYYFGMILGFLSYVVILGFPSLPR
jgi:hypothetical protein